MPIRKNDANKCPFGLKIPFGCKNAGEIIDHLAPMEILGENASEEEKKKLALTNARYLIWQNPCQRCRYAGKIFTDKDAVECNWATNTAGTTSEKGLLGSPYYSRLYDNIAYDGLYAYPIGFEGGENISRNLYYGIYSLLGDEDISEKIIKLAEEIAELDFLIKTNAK